MTTGIRRGARRSKPHNLSDRIPAVWCHRGAHLGTFAVDILGQSGIREMVALALFLDPFMSSSPPKSQRENTCHDCLYFKLPPASRHSTRGNCSLHHQWIEHATRTTCSEMSSRRLKKGIYQLFELYRGEWRYVLREKRLRTRLFLVTKGGKRAGC